MSPKLFKCLLGATHCARCRLFKRSKIMNKELLRISEFIISFLSYPPLKISHYFTNRSMGGKVGCSKFTKEQSKMKYLLSLKCKCRMKERPKTAVEPQRDTAGNTLCGTSEMKRYPRVHGLVIVSYHYRNKMSLLLRHLQSF